MSTGRHDQLRAAPAGGDHRQRGVDPELARLVRGRRDHAARAVVGDDDRLAAQLRVAQHLDRHVEGVHVHVGDHRAARCYARGPTALANVAGAVSRRRPRTSRRSRRAIDQHNGNCPFPAAEVRMNPFEADRLGWERDPRPADRPRPRDQHRPLPHHLLARHRGRGHRGGRGARHPDRGRRARTAPPASPRRRTNCGWETLWVAAVGTFPLHIGTKARSRSEWRLLAWIRWGAVTLTLRP